MTPTEFIEYFRRARVSAILRTNDAAAAGPAMQAAVDGGFSVIEFTLTTPGAFDLIRDFAAQPGLVVGAGTVLTPEDATRAVEAGARFLVSPVVDEAVIAEGVRCGVAVMPGTSTPTEMQRAHRAGAVLQKLFPAPAGGPSFVRSVMGPMPFLRIVPTNGVDGNNVRAFLDAGAWAVGFVATLFDPADMTAHAFDRIRERARSLLAAADAHRSRTS